MACFRATAFCFALRLRFAVRCSVLDSAPNTYRGSRPVALDDPSGKATTPSRPRSSSVPSHRPPHDVDLEGPLSAGSGEGQSRARPSAVRSWMSEREREPVSNQARRAAGPPDSRPEASSRSRAHGDDAVFSSSGPWGSRWTAGSRLPLPQFTVARKRVRSNAFPRRSMK